MLSARCFYGYNQMGVGSQAFLGGYNEDTIKSGMAPEGIKTSQSDQRVTADFTDMHLRVGIDSLCQLINQGLTVKHLRF